MDKTVSIIIPVYNLEDYISDCLDSVTAQSYPQLEIIPVDDGSSDGSGDICRKYAEKDSRIRLISQANEGLSAARNAGMRAAAGDYIAFVDGDDIIHRDYIRTLVECAERHGADVAVVNYVSVSSKEEFLQMNDLGSENAEVISPEEAVLRIERDSERFMITAWGKLYRSTLRDALEFPEGKLHEDEYVTYRALHSANKVVISGCRYYGYMKRDGSIMDRFTKKRMEDALEGMKEAIDYFSRRGDGEALDWAIRRYLFRIIIDYYRIRKEAPEDCKWANATRRLFSEEFKKKYPGVRKGTPFLYAAAFRIFNISPQVYCRFCDVFLKYSDDR